eukprot:TRINITY_DN25701_c0_g2_i1.p1 TRINITY_DN25701_c0_g2~~TRINITY_DN25701_c0_g2_i1.p1  ORF type:complete len:700 (-),score=183.60 TRINITY_DN25701_c0_g2_i1:101-2104(-)
MPGGQGNERLLRQAAQLRERLLEASPDEAYSSERGALLLEVDLLLAVQTEAEDVADATRRPSLNGSAGGSAEDPREALVSQVKSLCLQNEALAQELHELRRASGAAENGAEQVSASLTDGIASKVAASAAAVRAENVDLQRENQRLAQEVAGLREECAAIRTAAEASGVAGRGGGSAGASTQPTDSEGRLRAALTSRSTTTSELRCAISAVSSLLDEARRELKNAEVRERRAVYEELGQAMEKEDEDRLEAVLAKAREVQVDAVDIGKGEKKLLELRSLTPEQKDAKLARKLEVQKKKEAYILVKKDDVSGLQALLEGLPENTRWQDWRDSAGRSLWMCARDLRASQVQQYLAPKIGVSKQISLGNAGSGGTFAPWRRPVGRTRSGSLGGSFGGGSDQGMPVVSEPSQGTAAGDAKAAAPVAEIVTDGAAEVVQGRTFSRQASGSAGAAGSDGARSAAGSVPPSPAGIKPASVDESLAAATGAAADGDASAVASASADAAASGAAGAVGAAAVGGGVTSTPSTPASPNGGEGGDSVCCQQHTELRQKALRAVAQDDGDALLEILRMVDVSIWSEWKNKAGEKLLDMSQERRLSNAYAVLARELGLLKELTRETYVERERGRPGVGFFYSLGVRWVCALALALSRTLARAHVGTILTAFGAKMPTFFA